MANKKITDVDIVTNLADTDFVFVNQGQALKQIKKSDINKTLASDVNTLKETIKTKLDKNQGVINANKVLKVGVDGNIIYADMPTGSGGFSGNYNDLTNRPTIPTALSQLSTDSTHRLVTDAEKAAWNSKSSITEQRVNELIDARLPRSAEGVQY